MKVLKFGGTSVGKPDRMHWVANLVNDATPKIVVLSAISGTTNALVEIGDLLLEGKKNQAGEKIEELYKHYQEFIKGLYSGDQAWQQGHDIIDKHFNYIRALSEQPFTHKENKELVAEGELMSTEMFLTYIQSQGMDAAMLPALDFMRIDEHSNPSMPLIEEKLEKKLKEAGEHTIYITQGFICRNPEGEVDNLRRGGSDYTASLIGAAQRADEVQIWTDIDGMHNNDPRVVKQTYPIARLQFNEAAELAYFGAKILHPATIRPAQDYNIPVRLLNTMKPDAPGTLISNEGNDEDIKAIAAKDGITAIKIKSSRMLLAYGFLRKVFEIFEKYATPIDMITTSEVAVSVTIDDDSYLDNILEELREYGVVEVDQNQSIVCVVGSMVADRKGVILRIFDAMKDIPVRMISYGGSKHNISMLINEQDKSEALNALNDGLFYERLKAM